GRAPEAMTISDDGRYLAFRSYGRVDLVDLEVMDTRWSYDRGDGGAVEIHGGRVFSAHDDDAGEALVIHGLDGRMLGELRLAAPAGDVAPFAVDGAGTALAVVDATHQLVIR